MKIGRGEATAINRVWLQSVTMVLGPFFGKLLPIETSVLPILEESSGARARPSQAIEIMDLLSTVYRG